MRENRTPGTVAGPAGNCWSYADLHPLLASTALFSLPALTLAAATTAVYRASVSTTNRIGATVGTLQALSTVGCIAGTGV